MSITGINEKSAKDVKEIKSINVCYSSDKNYAKYLSVSIVSLLSTKAFNDKIRIYILDGGLTDLDKKNLIDLKRITNFELKFVDVDKDLFAKCPLGGKTHLTIATYYRLLLANLLHDVEKIIYLDCDIEIKSSLKELFFSDITDIPFAGVQDIGNQKHCKRLDLKQYFNSGMLLMNLEKFRETCFSEKVFDFIQRNIDKLDLHDQDVLNLYFSGSIKSLDKKWNTQAALMDDDYNEKVKNASIIHFVSKDKGDFIFKNFQNAMKTNYKKDLLKIYFRRISKFILQWFFAVRNKNKSEKIITILGIKFCIKRK